MGALRAVVAEDDVPIRELVVHHLKREGYETLAVSDGASALRAARDAAGVVVLDLGLPVVDGFDVTRTLRREGRSVPIVMLSARADEVDRVVGLEVGADDYVCKPFSPRELVARVKAVVRRSDPTAECTSARSFGRFELDERSREARVDGRCVALMPQEYALLRVMVANAGIALSRSQLLANAWGDDYEGDERTVDTHVRKLRRRLEEPFGLSLFETLRGFGYKFRRT